MPALFSNFLSLLVMVLWALVLARVLVSWVVPRGGGGGLVAFIYQATEPILAPVRRLLPPTAGVDWAPLIVMLLLGALTRIVGRL